MASGKSRIRIPHFPRFLGIRRPRKIPKMSILTDFSGQNPCGQNAISGIQRLPPYVLGSPEHRNFYVGIRLRANNKPILDQYGIDGCLCLRLIRPLAAEIRPPDGLHQLNLDSYCQVYSAGCRISATGAARDLIDTAPERASKAALGTELFGRPSHTCTYWS